MPSAKPRYTGRAHMEPPAADSVHPWGLDLSPLEREMERRLPGLTRSNPPDVDSLEQLRAELMAAARWAIGELAYQEQAPTKQEIRATHSDLIETLSEAAAKLRRVAPQHDAFLPEAFDGMELADELSEALALLRRPLQLDRYRKVGREKYESDVAKSMCSEVIESLEQRGIRISATAPGQEEFKSIGAELGSGPQAERLRRAKKAEAAREKTSDVIKLLKAMGDAVGIERELTAWKRILSAARQNRSQESE